MKVLYLSRRDVEHAGPSMPEIIEVVEEMFKEKGNGRVEMPPKPGIHPRPDAFIHAMPAYIPSLNAAGMKWVSGYPQNVSKHLPYISGLLVLNDPDTGIPTGIMDCTWITAKRTGAATAVAAKFLARSESSTVGILACGVQGRSNLEALACVFDLTKVKAYDIDGTIASNFSVEMGTQLDVEVEPVTSPRDAVEGCDLVVTSGPISKNPSPAIEPDWLAPGAFACPLDFDSYWSGQALSQIDRLATDDLQQLAYYRSVGYFRQTPRPYGDLGEIVSGKKAGRRKAEERTMSINLGLALEDVAVAPLILRRAQEHNIGMELDL